MLDCLERIYFQLNSEHATRAFSHPDSCTLRRKYNGAVHKTKKNTLLPTQENLNRRHRARVNVIQKVQIGTKMRDRILIIQSLKCYEIWINLHSCTSTTNINSVDFIISIRAVIPGGTFWSLKNTTYSTVGCIWNIILVTCIKRDLELQHYIYFEVQY